MEETKQIEEILYLYKKEIKENDYIRIMYLLQKIYNEKNKSFFPSIKIKYIICTLFGISYFLFGYFNSL